MRLTENRDMLAAMNWLAARPGVTKVVPGALSNQPHSNKPGSVKFVTRESTGSVKVRVFGSDGMRNVHVYCSSEAAQALEDALSGTKPKPAPEPKAAPPIPAETPRLTRTAKTQPVYPATPSPMKSAQPVAESEVRGRLVTITPEIALNWLERNTTNRPLRDVDVRKYARDMREGRWKAGGVVIKFSRENTIINGQHTLWAVVESGVTIQAYVLMGLDPDVVLVEDDHARRRLTDVVKIQHRGWTVTGHHAAVATMLRQSVAWHEGGSTVKPLATRQEEVTFLEQHRDAIEFAVSAFSRGDRRGIAVSAVMAPIARAYYTEDRERLRAFVHVVQTGLVTDVKENTAILLRNWLLASIGTLSAGMVSRIDTYRKTERALRAYLDNEQLKVLKAGLDELFLLPGEKKPKRR